MLRRLLRRTLLAPFLLLPLLSCGRAQPSARQAAQIIATSAQFRSPKVAYIPRVLSVHAKGGIPGSVGSVASPAGEMLGLDQMAGVDAAVAMLQARGRLQVEDFMNAAPAASPPPMPMPEEPEPTLPSDSTAPTDSTGRADTTGHTGSGAPAPAPSVPADRPFAPLPNEWIHTLRITPRASLDSSLLSPDDGDDADDVVPQSSGGTALSLTSVQRTPGWKLAIGNRDFGRVLQVHDGSDDVHVDPGEVVVDFAWRWRLTPAGDVFDGQGPEFRSLPESVQRAAAAGGLRLDTAQPQWSRATLERVGRSGWRVKGVDWKFGEGRTIDAP